MTIPILPDSAPFTTDQRAWLNGFFAGVLSLDPSVSAPTVGAGRLPGLLASTTPPAAVEAVPWHDETMPLTERLALAAGRPLEQRLMAAMAQLDCGTCGYVCQTYAQAIASGAERNLTKCTPGGKETSRKLKELMSQAA